MHNLIFNNCHSFIADILNDLEYKEKKNWNQIDVFKLVTFSNKYISWMTLFKTYFWTVFLYTILFSIALFIANLSL